jgi:hypothetical protein
LGPLTPTIKIVHIEQVRPPPASGLYL